MMFNCSRWNLFPEEMDALRGLGHACGHNLIAMAGCAVALAVKASLVAHGISGKVILLGTPGMKRRGKVDPE